MLRPPAYEQILDELVRFVPEGHTQSGPIREAAEKVRQINQSMSMKRRNAINSTKMAKHLALTSFSFNSLFKNIRWTLTLFQRKTFESKFPPSTNMF